MPFFEIWLSGLIPVMGFMTLLWLISLPLKNASIVDPFWGTGFCIAAVWYFWQTGAASPRAILLLTLVLTWGLRLSIYLGWRNIGKGEDFRYQEFRRYYGPERYWWFSFFQVFLLQGALLWIISVPLLAGILSTEPALTVLDFVALGVWLFGFVFEAGGDWQLARFKANPANKGKLLDSGFWRYTRHPNYFGDAAVWWGFGLFAVLSGYYWTLLGPVLMTTLLVKVSGVALLERSMKNEKPGYAEYVRKTSAFIPWFPKK